MFDWFYVFPFYLLILHIRFAASTIYLHRGVVHGALEISPMAESIFKFLLWTTSMYFENYKKILRAQHYYHHKYSDSDKDVHSPYHMSIKQLLDFHHNEPGRPYYVSPEELEKHSKNIPIIETWADKNIYLPYQYQGMFIWLPITLILFGPIATIIIYFLLKYISEVHTIIGNYVFHKWGYQNSKKLEDRSKNVIPFGILLAGEELHNNHHNHPGSAKLSVRWFEFDLGWLYIKLLSAMSLVKIKRK